jgi:hypothetical protein
MVLGINVFVHPLHSGWLVGGWSSVAGPDQKFENHEHTNAQDWGLGACIRIDIL